MDAQAHVVGKLGGRSPRPESKAADVVLPGLQQLCGERIHHPGATGKLYPWRGTPGGGAGSQRSQTPAPIAEQLKAAQREAQEHRAPDGPKKKAPDRGDR